MTRAAFLGTMSLIFLACAALPACSQEEEARHKLIAECSDPLPRDVDVCLERTRVQEETDPSPEVQRLLADLIQRQARMTDLSRHRAIWQDGPPPDSDRGVSSYDTGSSLPPTSPDLLGNEPDGSVGPDDHPPPPQPEGGDPYDAPPDSAQQDPAAPDLQGNPSDVGPADDGSRPAYQHDHATHPPHGS